MMSKRFLLTLVTLIVIGVAASIAIFLAKGYRFDLSSDPTGSTFFGTGIMSITSVPDQASVYLDDHLTTATNANINSLVPKEYDVRIVKEGFIPWQKKVAVKEGLVTEIKATLFRSLPSVYPLTYSGAEHPVLSPDGFKMAFVVPGTDKKSGVWVWGMSERPIAFSRGAEPHQIALPQAGIDYSQATIRWSPDSSQVLLLLPERALLLDETRLNDPPRDITPILQPTLRTWEEDQKKNDLAKLELIPDPVLRNTASDSATLRFSPDETKILYSKDGKTDFKVTDLVSRKTYDMPKGYKIDWLPDSEHLVLVEDQGGASPAPSPSTIPTLGEKPKNNFRQAKVSVIEFDGFNKAEIYAGTFDIDSVFAWPDSSRLVVISSFNTATASQPNLYGINLK